MLRALMIGARERAAISDLIVKAEKRVTPLEWRLAPVVSSSPPDPDKTRDERGSAP